MNNIGVKRYVVYDFVISHPILIDRIENTITLYDYNIYGQIYNLKNPKHYAVSAKTINGLIRRTQNPDYSFANSKAVDGYIYEYLMTPEQQTMCHRKPSIPGWNEQIALTDDYAEAIRNMCEWVYEHEYCGELGDKEAERGRLLKYCGDFLAGREPELPPKKQEQPTVERKTHDRDGR